MSFLLRFCAFVYGGIVWCRGWLYDRKVLRSYQSFIPVVSIGNITAGGNGKTPLCMSIAEELGRRGLRVAILSRGYGGRLKGPYRVSPNDEASCVGDEPLLMARAGFIVYVSRSRVKGAKLIESEQSADVILLDDGLQHRALCRNLDIVSIFAGTDGAIRDFLRGKLLPAGLFREQRSRALERASLVVVSHRTVLSGAALPPIDQRLMRVLPKEIPVFQSYLEAHKVEGLDSGIPLKPQEVVAFAAIANPGGFFESLRQSGYTVCRTFSYPDHYKYTTNDLKVMANEYPDRPLVCTEKDAVKLMAMEPDLRSKIAVLRVSAKVVPADAFVTQILRSIQR